MTKEWISPYAQQGDVLIKKVGSEFSDVFETTYESIPEDAKLLTTKVLHEGRHHTHAFTSGTVKILEKDGVKFIQVLTDATLSHPEHGPLTLPARDAGYFLDLVQEYDHLSEEQRNIVD